MAIFTLDYWAESDVTDGNRFNFSYGTNKDETFGDKTFFWLTMKDGKTFYFSGTDFRYDSRGKPVGGTVTGYTENNDGVEDVVVSGIKISLKDLYAAILTKTTSDDLKLTEKAYSGDDTLTAFFDRLYFDRPDNMDLFGFAGNDTFLGGTGHLLDGGAGNDTVSYAGRGTFSADLTNKFQYSNNNDVYFSIENLIGDVGNDLFYGDSKANTLSGNAGDDDLNGRSGNDKLFGGDGRDVLTGGPGKDLLHGGAGFDIASYAGGKAVIADLTRGGLSGKDAKGDIYTSIGGLEGSNSDDILKGDNGDNFLGGLKGNDQLDGRSGDDILTGGLGKDVLVGGKGEDTFRCITLDDSKRSTGIDVIRDFHNDIIDFSAIDTNPRTTNVNAFTYIGTDEFSFQKRAEIRNTASGNMTYIYGDSDGDGKADFEIKLFGVVKLSDDSFSGVDYVL